MTSRPRYRLRSGELIILITLGLVALIVVSGNFGAIFEKLYSPYAAFVAVVMLVEYVLLKGADRSALYQRELEAARAKRREDLLMFRALESELEEMKSSLGRDGADDDGAALARSAGNDIDRLLGKLRSRI